MAERFVAIQLFLALILERSLTCSNLRVRKYKTIEPLNSLAFSHNNWTKLSNLHSKFPNQHTPSQGLLEHMWFCSSSCPGSYSWLTNPQHSRCFLEHLTTRGLGSKVSDSAEELGGSLAEDMLSLAPENRKNRNTHPQCTATAENSSDQKQMRYSPGNCK